MIYSVIGCNYGDEGKGLAVDLLASHSPSALVVRHNGGAQSGHTVETGRQRFVFHELSAGSFRGADTLWAPTFLPDLYKLREETEDFRNLAGFVPKIYASPECCMTSIDDVLINMLLETSRGDSRHGSCGMGINEADLRGKAGFALPLGEVLSMDLPALYRRLLHIRQAYSLPRLLQQCPASESGNLYYDLLTDDSVLMRYAEEVIASRNYVTLVRDIPGLLDSYRDIIFESGQGLRLDAEFRENWPHVTASRTGLTNPAALLRSWGRKLDLAVYVTRSYVTKHGAGPLPYEIAQSDFDPKDCTNEPNPWQGALRCARWADPEDLARMVRADREQCPAETALLVTHLNETGGRMLFRDKDRSPEELLADPGMQALFGCLWLSASPFSRDTVFPAGKTELFGGRE